MISYINCSMQVLIETISTRRQVLIETPPSAGFGERDGGRAKRHQSQHSVNDVAFNKLTHMYTIMSQPLYYISLNHVHNNHSTTLA